MSDQLYAVILCAAGISRRLGGSTPKQYLTYRDKTLLEYSLQPWLLHQRVGLVVVVLSADDTQFAQLDISQHPKIVTTIGGATRADSVFAGVLTVIEQQYPWVLVHDVARANLYIDDINKLIHSSLSSGISSILAAPVADTIKQKTAVDCFKTIDRDQLVKILTPQMVKTHVLHRALQHCKTEAITITDESSALEAIGEESQIILGRSDNIKLTYQEDWTIMKALLAENPHQPDH